MSVDLNFENAVWLRVMNDHLKVLDERLAERKSSSTRKIHELSIMANQDPLQVLGFSLSSLL